MKVELQLTNPLSMRKVQHKCGFEIVVQDT